jgi:hypothetical protein
VRTENNVKRYARLMQPVTRDQGNANIEAFFEVLGALREKHHIPDCLCILKVNVEYADGQVGEAITSMHYGSHYESEAMAAYALGNARAQVTAEVNKLAKGQGMKEALK